VKRTHLSRQRRRQRRIAVSHDAWCTRGVATQRRGDEADDRTRIAALPTAANSAQGDWPGDGGAHARQLARRFERAAFRAALRRVARGRDGGARATAQEIDSLSMQVFAAPGCWSRFYTTFFRESHSCFIFWILLTILLIFIVDISIYVHKIVI